VCHINWTANAADFLHNVLISEIQWRQSPILAISNPRLRYFEIERETRALQEFKCPRRYGDDPKGCQIHRSRPSNSTMTKRNRWFPGDGTSTAELLPSNSSQLRLATMEFCDSPFEVRTMVFAGMRLHVCGIRSINLLYKKSFIQAALRESRCLLGLLTWVSCFGCTPTYPHRETYGRDRWIWHPLDDPPTRSFRSVPYMAGTRRRYGNSWDWKLEFVSMFIYQKGAYIL